MKTYFKNDRAALLDEGWEVPTEVNYQQAKEDNLTSRERLAVMWFETDIKTKEREWVKTMRRCMLGSPTTAWRTKKKLQQKGYIN